MGAETSKKGEVVAVFGAHPDDLDWSSGGTVARWVREGKEVYFILTTSGEGGEDHQRQLVLPRAEMAEIREMEQRQAASVLGVKDVVFLGQPDGKIAPTLEFRDQLVNVLRRLKPQLVISLDPGHWAFDNFYMFHPDHRATSLAVYDAIYPAAGSASYVPHPDEGLPPHKVREVYFSGTRFPNTYVDITATIELKIQALASHASQLTNTSEIARYVRDNAQRHGEQVGCRYAEAFRRLEVPQ